jgi:hypothetical protein
MANDPQAVYDRWMAEPAQPVWMIDETRQQAPEGHGEFIVFTCVCMSADAATDALQLLGDARAALPLELRGMSFKGRLLWGRKNDERYAPIADAVLKAVRTVGHIQRVLTTSKHITDIGRRFTCDLTVAGDRAAMPAKVAGRELLSVLTFLKWLANRLQVGARWVDVLIDRSAQLGLDPSQRGLSPEQFEMLEAESLNTSPGGTQTDLVSPASFRIYADSDDGPFRDLLLFPDAVGYLGLYRADSASMDGPKAVTLAGTALVPIDVDMSCLWGTPVQ